MEGFRDFVAQHISHVPQRDLDVVLPWLAPQWCGKALTLDLDAVTAWDRVLAYFEDEFVVRKCPHCAAEFPHLRALLAHACPLERCVFPCPVVGVDLQEHRKTCRLVPVACSWCHKSFPRHVQHLCPDEPSTCDACRAVVTRSTAQEHAAACPEQQVPCPHAGCDMTVGQVRLAHHVFQCPMRVMHCRWCAVQHTAKTTHDCPQQPVTCTVCTATMPRGPRGTALKRHMLVAHTIPATVARLRKGELDPAHALAMRFQCPCATCRQYELISRFHQEREDCPQSCDHPLCPHQLLGCGWPGCTEQHPLQHLAEHERQCPQRRSSCAVCGEGPLDLETLRQHMFPRCAAVTAAMAPEREAAGRAHLASCVGLACPVCTVWKRAFFFSGKE